MINLIVALEAEAKPIAQKLELKKTTTNPFVIYKKSHYHLIVSGPGKTNAAAATAYTQTISQANHIHAWLNVGIAGHKSMELGTAVLANQVIDAGSNLHFNLASSENEDCTTTSVITVDKPEHRYPMDAVYEMEAFGVVHTASRFSSLELIRILKIISDNKEHSANNIRAQDIKLLIQSQCDLIAAQAHRLGRLLEGYSTQG